MNTGIPSRVYKQPRATVVVLGGVDNRVVERLSRVLRLHGPRGLKIVVVADNFVEGIETLRDLLLSNYAFTVELYFAKPDELGRYLEDYKSVVSILALNTAEAQSLPSELKNVVEVL